MDLHPFPVFLSAALAVRGNMQVGGLYDGESRACLWHGTPQSYVDLHPSGPVRSVAYATDGVLQGGQVQYANGALQAALWNGTAQSFVNLNPPGTTQSTIRGMAPGVQVGWVHPTPGSSARGAVWYGSAASWVDLHPPGVPGSSFFRATTGRIHVGEGRVDGSSGAARALINFGTVDSWVDLHQFLSSHFTTFSAANAVHQDGDSIYVGGYAVSNLSGDKQAILWIGTMSCYANCDDSTVTPTLTVSDFACFLQRFAAGDGYANCDQSTTPPVLNIADFGCFLQRFAAGCP